MGAETNDKSQNNPPSAIARDVDIWVLNPETQAKLKQESAKNASTGGLSTLDALAKVNEPKNEQVAATENSAEHKDDELIISDRLVALNTLGANLEKIIGLFDGPEAKHLREAFSTAANMSEYSSIKNPDLLSKEVPAANTEKDFNQAIAELTPAIQAMLTAEGGTWKDVVKNNALLQNIFSPQLRTEMQFVKDGEDKGIEPNERSALARARAQEFRDFVSTIESNGLTVRKEGGDNSAMKNALQNYPTLYNYLAGNRELTLEEMAANTPNAKDGEAFYDVMKGVIAATEKFNDQTVNPYDFRSTHLQDIIRRVHEEGEKGEALAQN